MPIYQPKKNTTAQREVIRSFAAGNKKAVSTGGTIIKLQNDLPRRQSESGFSILIKEGTRYKINGLTIECVRTGEHVRLIVQKMSRDIE
ncbi:MAG: hypothetical protein Ta2B_30500 [Termitinemataceae bacterium]|nr:MAG: hypothetical protein Ta2B_30500 [Termitinemataceae bacterium]